MVVKTRSRSRAAQMAEATQTTFDPIPSPKKRAPKPKGTKTAKTDGNRSRPRIRGLPGAKPRSASTRTPPRKSKADSVDTERHSKSKSVSRKRATPTKKGGSIIWNTEDAEEAVAKTNVKAKARSQSKASLKKEPVTNENPVKVKPAAKKPPTQKRPRDQSQPKQVQKNETTKKPKLEVKNSKAKDLPTEKPAGRAKRSAFQAPPKKSWTAEAIEPEDEPIAMRTRSRSGPLAPPPFKKAPAPRAPRTRAKKAQSIRAVEVPISVEEPVATGTPQNESKTPGKDNQADLQSLTQEIKQEILPREGTGSAKTIPEAKAQLRAHRKPATGKVSTSSEPSSEDTFEVPLERGPVLNDAIDSIVSAIHQNKDIGYPGKTLAGICFSILARAGISALRRGVPEDTGTEVCSTSTASVSSSVETVRLDQAGGSAARMTPVPTVGAFPDSSLNLDHSTPDVESEHLSFSLHFHVEKKNQGAQCKSYIVLRFTQKQQEQLAAIFRGCFNPRE